MSVMIGPVITAVATAVLVYGERAGDPRLVWLSKPTACAGFLMTALMSGALDTSYGVAVLVGLILSTFGDLFLIPKSTKGPFLAGLVAFLLGHVGYTVAFVIRGVDTTWTLGALAVAVPIALVVAKWVLPHTAKLKGPVIAYITVITTMVTLALGTTGVEADWRLLVGAILFFVSDLFVARHRFVAPGFVNKLLGLPLYFGAQILLALSVTG